MRYRVVSLMELNNPSDPQRKETDLITNMAINFSLHIITKHTESTGSVKLTIRSNKDYTRLFLSQPLSFDSLQAAKAAFKTKHKDTMYLIVGYLPNDSTIKQLISPQNEKYSVTIPKIILKQGSNVKKLSLLISQLLMIYLQDKLVPHTLTSSTQSLHKELSQHFINLPPLSLTAIDEAMEEAETREDEADAADSRVELNAHNEKHTNCCVMM